MKPAIYLDRDGVLIENRKDYVKSLDDVVFIPEAFEAMEIFSKLDLPVFVVSNQSCVGRGIVPLYRAMKLNRQIIEIFQVLYGVPTHALICPHAPEDNCLCRKPKVGMLAALCKEYNTRSGWFIGDSEEDMDAAKLFNLIPMLVMTGRGEEAWKRRPFLNVRKYANILEAAEQIRRWHNV